MAEVDELLRGLNNKDAQRVQAAARALAQFPSVTTAKALCKLLQHRDATVRATAADVLLDMDDVDALCEALTFTIWNDIRELRPHLVEKIGEMADRRALPQLRKCVDWSWLLLRPTPRGIRAYRKEKAALLAAIERIETATSATAELPRPASAPQPDAATLPRIASAPTPDVETLPRIADAPSFDIETLPIPSAKEPQPDNPSEPTTQDR